MKSRIEIKRICAWCGKEFIAYKTTTNCCSHKCGNALYKKRKRDAAIIANNNLTEKIVTEKPIEKIKDKPFLTITETVNKSVILISAFRGIRQLVIFQLSVHY
ncbi:hypothetical protein [Phocaeicola plebeius]|uniref:hypothetical protein n=1 Tax=Phocaeicola plebeius TaxID=310297 RepID=UPI003AF00403